MKKSILALLIILLAACSPSPQPISTITPNVPIETTEAPVAVVPTSTLAEITPSVTPFPTSTIESTISPSPTPFTEPVIVERFPMHEGTDGIGFGSAILALPGEQVWEATSGGGVRIYNSTDMTVLKSLNLGGQEYALARLAGNEEYVWVMFYGAGDVADLFRVSRVDYSYKPVNLPESCTYDSCQWSFLKLDEDILWVGGYDELWAFDVQSTQPEAKFLFSEQANTVNPAGIVDVEVTEDGQIWALFSTDASYIVILDRQKLLKGTDQEPQFVYFANNSVQFVSITDGVTLAGESRSGNVVEQPAVMYRIDATEVELNPKDGNELPGELDFFNMSGMNITDDGRYVWLIDHGGRKLFWVDPKDGKVAGVLQIYPGETPSTEDPNMIMSISFDGEFLWASGSEIVRIALP